MGVVAGAWLTCALITTGAAQIPATGGVRIPPVPMDGRSDAQRAAVSALGETPMRNALAIYLHNPALAQILVAHERYLANDSTLPPRHRALLALRTAWLTRSEYLWAHRAPAARAAGLTADDLIRIARGPTAPGWDPFERAVLLAADELHMDSFISDATWTMLDTRYEIPQLIDTIDTPGGYTIQAGILNSAGVAIEDGFDARFPAGIPVRPAAPRSNVRLEGKVPRIPPQDAPGGRGGGANVFRTFNRHPPADRVRGAVNQHVNNRLTISPRQRELLLIRIGILARSEYEYAAHARAGRQVGITEADLARILAGPGSGLDPLEDALLRATDELFDDDRISDATWTTLAQTFTPPQILDVMVAVGGYRSTSMLISSAGVQLDPNMNEFRFPPALR